MVCIEDPYLIVESMGVVNGQGGTGCVISRRRLSVEWNDEAEKQLSLHAYILNWIRLSPLKQEAVD